MDLLPNGVSLRLSFKTWDSKSLDQANTLIQHGAVPIKLETLSKNAIQEWLVAAKMNPDWATDIMAATNGYPIHVAAAIDLLRDAESTSALVNIKPSIVLGKQTERAWNGLDVNTQVAAIRLAAFKDPLEIGHSAKVLGIGPIEWAVLEKKLCNSGIFTGAPLWFHELRRRHIWTQVLGAAERDSAIEGAIDYWTPQLVLPTANSEPFVEYSRLVREHSKLLLADPMLHTASLADVDELAVAASLLELLQPASDPLLVENVLLYAREVFHANGDLVAALHRIANRGLIHITADTNVTIVSPMFETNEAVRNFIVGRAAVELGRLPIPAVATAIVEHILRPTLGEFLIGRFGLGTPGVSELAQIGIGMQRVSHEGSLQLGRKGPNLLLRFHYGELPLYGAISYEDAEDRNKAATRLDGFSADAWERHLVIDEVLMHPLAPVPSLRFLQAAELLTGLSLANPTSGALPPPHLSTPLSLDEEMARRAQLLSAIRDMCGSNEKFAYGLEKPLGFVFSGDEEHNEVAYVSGRSGAQRMSSELFSSGINFHRVDLARVAKLGPEERLGSITWRNGTSRPDPVLTELGWLAGRAAAFNKLQDRVTFALDQEILERAIRNAFRRRSSDAVQLSGVLQYINEKDVIQNRLKGRDTYAVVFLKEPNRRFVPAADSLAFLTSVINRTSEFGIRLLLVPWNESDPILVAKTFIDQRNAFAMKFDLNPSSIRVFGSGNPRHSLAELLGYKESEISFQYKD